jgi:hypothetical protein
MLDKEIIKKSSSKINEIINNIDKNGYEISKIDHKNMQKIKD